MNKEIEEMALEMPEEIKDPLDNSRYIIFGKSLRRAIAQTYYNAGYRKIDENCAVITKAELKEYKRQAVKEFAEKLKKKLFEFFQDNEGLDGKISVGPLYVDIIGVDAEDGTIISLGLIDELLKEYE